MYRRMLRLCLFTCILQRLVALQPLEKPPKSPIKTHLIHPSDVVHCKKTLWLTGLHVGTNGVLSEYIGNSTSYLNSYFVALRSVQKHAPSLLPVLIVQGDLDPAAHKTIKKLGGHVVQHHLSFQDVLLSYKKDYQTGLIGSFLRLDIPSIMLAVPRAVDLQHAEADYVLWTDPDVLFFNDIDSCALPKPPILSLGPDATPGNKDNCGVIYYNVKGYSQIFDDLMDFARSQQFWWPHDQPTMMAYFADRGQKYISQLPDIYNYKPYWGRPVVYGDWSLPMNVTILHTHGPKLAMSMCALNHFKAKNLARADAITWVWEDNSEAAVEELNKECGCKSEVTPCRSLYYLVAVGYAQDGGDMYRETIKLTENLLNEAKKHAQINRATQERRTMQQEKARSGKTDH